jgi:hypothetical protein
MFKESEVKLSSSGPNSSNLGDFVSDGSFQKMEAKENKATSGQDDPPGA